MKKIVETATQLKQKTVKMKYFEVVIFVILIVEILSAPVSEEVKTIIEKNDEIEDSAELDKIREKKSPGCTNCGYGHSTGGQSYSAPTGYSAPQSSGYSSPIVAPASTYSSSGSYSGQSGSGGYSSGPAQNNYQAPAPIHYSAPIKPSYGSVNSYSSSVPSHGGAGYSSGAGHGSQYSSQSYGGSSGGYREVIKNAEQNAAEAAGQNVGSIYGGQQQRPAYGPGPQVQCGSNLLFGCAPRVQQVPCIPSTGYSGYSGFSATNGGFYWN